MAYWDEHLSPKDVNHFHDVALVVTGKEPNPLDSCPHCELLLESL
jgi:hypothetical protein